jgi:hypothetical protein
MRGALKERPEAFYLSKASQNFHATVTKKVTFWVLRKFRISINAIKINKLDCPSLLASVLQNNSKMEFHSSN